MFVGIPVAISATLAALASAIQWHDVWLYGPFVAGWLAAGSVAKERWPGQRQRDRWRQMLIGLLVITPPQLGAALVLTHHLRHSPIGALVLIIIDILAVVGLAVIGRTIPTRLTAPTNVS